MSTDSSAPSTPAAPQTPKTPETPRVPSVNIEGINPEGLEITLGSALELAKLSLGSLVDIRQAFELEIKGRIPDTVHIPLFEVKQLLGQPLTENEQETLDAGQPTPMDVQGFFTTVNRLHHTRDHIVLLVCNSGRRSLYAAQLLRSMGYPKTLSVAGGFQAWKKLQAGAG
jgi:rhodanese-related sulfurtransferase